MRIFILLFFATTVLYSQIPTSGPKSIVYRTEKAQYWLTLTQEYSKLSNDEEPLKIEVLKLIEDFAKYKCILKGFKDLQELSVRGRIF